MEIVSFPNSAEFRKWLKRRIWLRILKKKPGVQALTYAEALDEALCFGWIDGQKRGHDLDSWLQRFTPRKPRSQWSKRNTEHVTRLIKARKMTPAGLREVQAARKDGRWKSAYASTRTAKIPAYFLKELNKNKKAKAFFATLNKTSLFAIYYRLQSAKKEETRQKRMAAILKMLASGQKVSIW